MYYLLEFDCDNTIDILEQNSLIYDDPITVGDTVTAVYKIGKRHSTYDSRVLQISGKCLALQHLLLSLRTSLVRAYFRWVIFVNNLLGLEYSQD